MQDRLQKIFKSKSVQAAFLASAVVFGGIYYFKNRAHPAAPVEVSSLTDIEQSKFLTQNAADIRYMQVQQGSISYRVDLVLSKGERFNGLVTCDLIVKHNFHDLFFEFRGESLYDVYVNGTKIEVNWNKLFIRIPKELLNLRQSNRINFRYQTKYAADGCGLHSFTDTDGKQYLYSQGESYFCNRFFPCMDQPDLKAKLRFTVLAPEEWVVISNEHFEPQLTKTYDFNALSAVISDYQPQDLIKSQYEGLPIGYKQWVFGETPKLPTYLFAIISGEYWSIRQDEFYNGISQTIYCRESLKEHCLKIKDFVFEVTTESMKFYENFFGVPYQFHKYDTIFCAEYNWGAMENPGCVTFNDQYVFREQKPQASYTQLANTIAHEMAHHWFGDYVTMKWWNDLWLNESYADFISHFCLERLNIKSIPLSNIPVMFNTRKGWGYREDQMVTTHSIAGNVINTEVAENIFDGITYSKGASVMKQLLCIMGDVPFGQACGNYFRKFAWQNAKLEDLIASLQEKFHNPEFNLQQWKKQWIETTGMNEIEPEWDPSNRSPQARLTITQRPALPEFPTLRIHKLKIAFFKEDGTIHSQDHILQDKETNYVHYDGQPGYRAILLNYEDQSFVKVLLDEYSLQYFSQHLHYVTDVLTRTLIYRALFDTVRDGKISSEAYVDFLLHSLPKEESDEVLTTQFLYLQTAVNSLTPRCFKKILSRRIFGFLIQALEKEGLSKNRLIIIRSQLLSFTSDETVIQKLVDWWNGTDEDLKSLELTNDSKWSIVRLVHRSKLFDNQQELRKELLQRQLEADKSDASKKAKVRCEAYLVNEAQRRALWDSYCDPLNKESAHMLAESMTGFNNSSRYEELHEYQELFFLVINEIFKSRSTDFAKTFYDYLFPDTDDLASLQNYINATLKKTDDTQVTLKKKLAQSLDQVKRQVKAFECFIRTAPIAQQHHE